MLQLVVLQYVFAFIVLVYVSVLDVRSREISNRVWVIAYPVGGLLTIVGLVVDLLSFEMVVFSLGVSVVLGFVLFYFGFFGGADMKTLIFVALTVPAYPTAKLSGEVAAPFVLTMFCNSVFLSLIYPLSIFLLNVKDLVKGVKMFEGINLTVKEKVMLFFTARKISLERLEKDLTYFPSETIVNQDGQSIRRVLRFVKAETDLSQHLTKLKENKELYKDGVLATPTIPFVALFTLALAIAPFDKVL